MSDKPVLDLGALDPERPFIAINGQRYRLKVPMDMDLVTMARIATINERLERRGKKPPTIKIAAEFSRAIDTGVRLIMFDPIPDEVMDKLNEVAKLAILDAFPRATTRAGSPPNRKARRAMARSTSRVSSPA